MPVGSPYVRATVVEDTGALFAWPEGEMDSLLVQNHGPGIVTCAFGAVPLPGVADGRFVLLPGQRKRFRNLAFYRLGARAAASTFAKVEMIAWQKKLGAEGYTSRADPGVNPNQQGPGELVQTDVNIIEPPFVLPAPPAFRTQISPADTDLTEPLPVAEYAALWSDLPEVRIEAGASQPTTYALEVLASVDVDLDGLAGFGARRVSDIVTVDTSPIAHQRLPGDRVTLTGWTPNDFNERSATVLAVPTPTTFTFSQAGLGYPDAVAVLPYGRVCIVIPLGQRMAKAEQDDPGGAMSVTLDGMVAGPYPAGPTPWFNLSAPGNFILGGMARIQNWPLMLILPAHTGDSYQGQLGMGVKSAAWGETSLTPELYFTRIATSLRGNPGMAIKHCYYANGLFGCADFDQWRYRLQDTSYPLPGAQIDVAPSFACGTVDHGASRARLATEGGQTRSAVSGMWRNVFWPHTPGQEVIVNRGMRAVRARLRISVMAGAAADVSATVVGGTHTIYGAHNQQITTLRP